MENENQDTAVQAMPYVNVVVRRDANTIIPVQVPTYEVPLMQNIFGKENITVGEPCGSVDLDPENEYSRLGAKYGPEPVGKFFGEDDGERLKELIAKAVEARQKAAKAPKAAKPAA